jgi:hypothetical protein
MAYACPACDFAATEIAAPAKKILHTIANVRNIGQGERRRRKYKRLKLGGGQTYDRSSD